MRRATFCLVVVLSLLGAVPAAAAPDSAEGVWIVTLHEAHPASVHAHAMAAAHGGEVWHVYDAVLNGFSFRGSERAASNLSRDPRVRTVVADQPVAIAAQETPTGVRRVSSPDAWTTSTGSAGVIGILDTGIQRDHPDLKANIAVDLGMNCMDTSKPGAWDDGHGHGTHVAGTAAAVDNTEGVVGVAHAATLIPVKVLSDSGSGSWATVACGVNHLTTLVNGGQRVDVGNMSLGGKGSEGACDDGGLRQAVCQSVAAGIVYTVAAGNDSKDARDYVPANYPEVITVSALADFDGEPGGGGGCRLYIGLGNQCDDDMAKFSNYGPAIDVMAPGMSIYSTDKGSKYSTKSGTSMAAPHVAGVVGLVRHVNAALTPDKVKALLRDTGECPDTKVNAGTGDCVDQGQWGNDPDGIAEPLVHAARAAAAAGGSTTLSVTGIDATPDPFNTSTTVSFAFSADATWSAEVTEGSTTVVCSVTGPETAAKTGSFDWDGTTGDWDGTAGTSCQGGSPVADDTYTVTVTATAGEETATASTTVTKDTAAPTISDVSVTEVGSSSATITWKTDEAADSTVDYRVKDSDSFTRVSSTELVTSHSVGLSGLSASTTYEYQVTSTDAAGNTATSGPYEFKTLDAPSDPYVYTLDGWSVNDGSTWTANVTITIYDAGVPLSGATVTGGWSDGTDSSCTTNNDGQCTVDKGGIQKRISSVTFKVTSHVDADGNTATITVAKP